MQGDVSNGGWEGFGEMRVYACAGSGPGVEATVGGDAGG